MNTLNTLLTPDDVLEFVRANYTLEDAPQTCELIRRGFNDTYLVTAEQTKYIFRVYFNGKYYISSPEAFQFELDLLDYLKAQHITVSYPIRMTNGEFLGWTPTPLGERATTLFSFAEGINISEVPATVEQITAAGKTLAALHLAANNFSSPYERYHLNLKYLVDEPLRLIEEHKDEEGQALLASLPPIAELVDAVKSLSIDNGEYGIIHSDAHIDNMHFQGNEVTLFDFDHCGYGWRVYDLVAFHDNLSTSPKYQEAFLSGYESLRPLSQGERDCFPIFAHLRMLWDVGDMIATDALRNDLGS